MSTELDLLRIFFKSWEELHAIPKSPGRPSLESQMAAQRLVDCAYAVRNFKEPENKTAFVPPNEFRLLQGQINDIKPKDGWKPNGS